MPRVHVPSNIDFYYIHLFANTASTWFSCENMAQHITKGSMI